MFSPIACLGWFIVIQAISWKCDRPIVRALSVIACLALGACYTHNNCSKVGTVVECRFR